MSDAMNRKLAYAISGLLLAAVAAGMGLGPRTPWSYALFCLLYSVVTGLSFGAFTAFVLETIG